MEPSESAGESKVNGHDVDDPLVLCPSCGNVDPKKAFRDSIQTIHFPTLVLPDGLEVQIPALSLGIRQCSACNANIHFRHKFTLPQEPELEIVVPSVF